MSVAGVSARVIGEHLGISHCQVLKWRTGIRPIPARHIPKILSLLSSPPARTKPPWRPPASWVRGSNGAKDKAARAKRRSRHAVKASVPAFIDPREVDWRQQAAAERVRDRIEAETRREGFSSLVEMLSGIMAQAATAMGMPTPILEPRPVASSHPIAASKPPSSALAGVPAPTPCQAAARCTWRDHFGPCSLPAVITLHGVPLCGPHLHTVSMHPAVMAPGSGDNGAIST
jgi:hypothetical protein